MPRPIPPAPLAPLVVKRFKLDPLQRKRLAKTLGFEHLSDELAEAIGYACASYQATQSGNPDTTVGNTLAALDELTRDRTYGKAVARLATDDSGVDHVTLAFLEPLARAVMDGDEAAREKLDAAAKTRGAELGTYLRVVPKTEALRHFCGVLRVIFDAVAAPGSARTWANRRKFAMEVFTVIDIADHDFIAHPDRLTEYLRTDVSQIGS